MTKGSKELLGSPEFHDLVARRWKVSLVLTALLFVLYYGYILLVALNREFLSSTVGSTSTPVGIPIGAGVIVGAWVLTALYVIWANRRFDPEAARLRERATRV